MHWVVHQEGLLDEDEFVALLIASFFPKMLHVLSQVLNVAC